MYVRIYVFHTSCILYRFVFFFVCVRVLCRNMRYAGGDNSSSGVYIMPGGIIMACQYHTMMMVVSHLARFFPWDSACGCNKKKRSISIGKKNKQKIEMLVRSDHGNTST